MSNHVEIRWIQVGIVGGVWASILYPALLVVPGPSPAIIVAAAFLGPAIGIGSFGFYRLVNLNGPSVAASLGAVANFMAGGLFTAMSLVQLAVKYSSLDNAAQEQFVVIWLGLDVAWDVYIGLGTILFAWAALKHPRFRWPFAIPGFAFGVILLALNLYTFPQPPSEAGWVDIGPFVGLWYLATTIQAWRSLGWARKQLQTEN